MITNSDIIKIVEECKARGHYIKVGDIAFVLLCERLQDPSVAYRVCFNREPDGAEAARYMGSEAVVFLKSYIKDKHGAVKKPKSGLDITFEENKAQMVRLIEQAERDYADGLIEAKDRLKIVSELRVKLNDKFKVADDVMDSNVEVHQKYDDVCPYCHHEVARRPIGKDEAMRMYNLKDNEKTEE